MYNTRFYQLD